MDTLYRYMEAGEGPDQLKRLDVKTNPDEIKERAKWCGIGPGARVLDLGCQVGITTSLINEIIKPNGEIIGIDSSANRIKYAIDHYKSSGIEFKVRDITDSFDDLGKFDFIWMQFFLEFFLKESSEIVRKLISSLNPDGYLCLLDIDYNCLPHYQLPDDMEKVLINIISTLEKKYNFRWLS